MTAGRTYLDYNATAPLRPAARAAVLAAMEGPANASSVHAEGRAARAIVETARAQVAALFRAGPGSVTFTGSATEANMLALSPEFGLGRERLRFDALLISAVEHPSVRAGGRFPADRIETVAVDSEGVIDLDALDAMLKRRADARERMLVSVMAANNETGAIQPVAAVTERVHAHGGVLHCDAVQAAGRMPFDLEASGADLISVSSHKLGGPHGAGALIARNEDLRIPPLLTGGGQERGRRAGTENVAAIAGFGAAAEDARQNLSAEPQRLAELRDRAEAGVRAIVPETVVLSAGARRLPNTLCFAVPGIAAETAIMAFDLAGVALSAGAACSSGKVGPSEILKAMHAVPEIARGAMRLSIGWDTNQSDISRFLEVWKCVYVSLGQRRRERAA
jgi:cysteine desulfurase